MAGLSLTPLVVYDASIPETGRIQPHYGPLYPLFAAFTIATFGYGMWTPDQEMAAASRGRSKLQIQYLWLGRVCSFAPAP